MWGFLELRVYRHLLPRRYILPHLFRTERHALVRYDRQALRPLRRAETAGREALLLGKACEEPGRRVNGGLGAQEYQQRGRESDGQEAVPEGKRRALPHACGRRAEPLPDARATHLRRKRDGFWREYDMSYIQ